MPTRACAAAPRRPGQGRGRGTGASPRDTTAPSLEKAAPQGQRCAAHMKMHQGMAQGLPGFTVQLTEVRTGVGSCCRPKVIHGTGVGEGTEDSVQRNTRPWAASLLLRDLAVLCRENPHGTEQAMCAPLGERRGSLQGLSMAVSSKETE